MIEEEAQRKQDDRQLDLPDFIQMGDAQRVIGKRCDEPDPQRQKHADGHEAALPVVPAVALAQRVRSRISVAMRPNSTLYPAMLRQNTGSRWSDATRSGGKRTLRQTAGSQTTTRRSGKKRVWLSCAK